MDSSELEVYRELLREPTQANYEKVLAKMLVQIGAERGCMWLERENAFIYQGDEELRKTFPFSRQAVDTVLDSGPSFLSFDPASDERIRDSGSIMMNKVRSCLCTACREANGNVLVLAYFDNSMRSDPFSTENLAAIDSILALVPGAVPFQV